MLGRDERPCVTKASFRISVARAASTFGRQLAPVRGDGVGGILDSSNWV
ncbi:hypothetical protein EIB18_03260 [Caulobacter vibrioides]|uniref:Uncharacterized protein n=2 Tax=Caulobacter vibrioides TaxID=155892 RepID=Q9AAJ0_CAUVC|nr:hypothetical protein [Caulobacter vibrioides]YP_002516016.1 hypothetical protein CCNA_00643 [Caulobacter vibrioides NA1000]AAK22593.1 hypothetical protein CC_0607 [Caulobacter vibrioides CB15]ACL94108.1 hypothetical protein CCNA_00643 [Caulobacter vibrioides NA1000]ATC27452.1 hypothetical protein CA607_03245 [Caulobacter vibrioides]AZH11829.1 hypothetical protein EIB18_03260 [Caulobacter vibrioides]QXZ52689.1 hypothetical protein KZH45_03140 [Caulobacter vibrioides]